MPEDTARLHQITLSARRYLAIEGVKHVDSFDDDTIVLATDMGTVTVRGRNLSIQRLDLDAGEFAAEGEIDAFAYSQPKDARRNQRILQKFWR